MPDPLPEPGTDPRTAEAADEHAAVVAALRTVADDLTARGARAGGEAKDVLDAQALMAQDPSLVEDVEQRIQGR